MDKRQEQRPNQYEGPPRAVVAPLQATQMADILESMNDAIYTVDEAWQITYVNRKTEEIWSRHRAELLGHDLWTAFPHVVGTTAYHACVHAMQAREPITLEYFSATVNRWLDLRAQPTDNGLVVYFSDITLRKEAEATRQQQQLILQTIFDQIPVMILFLSADGRIHLVNQAWEKTLGWSLAEYEAHNLAIFDYLYPDPQERQRALEFIGASTGEWADFQVRRRDGQLVDITFANIHLADGTNLIIGQDITKRKQMERALHTSEDRFRRYFELGLVGMAITSPTQAWIEVNDKLCDILGYRQQELLDTTWAELTHPDDLALDVDQFKRMLAGEIDGYSIDKRFLRKDGQVIYATIAVTCQRQTDGTIDYIVGLLQDITARVASEAAVREQHRFTAALRDSLLALTGSLTVQQVMQQILDSAAMVVPSEAGSIILFEGDRGHVAYLRGFTPEAREFFKAYWFPLECPDRTNVLSTKRPYFVPDTQVDNDWITVPVIEWVRSSIGIPIEMRGEVIGLLAVDSATPHYFQPADVEKLQTFAHYAGLALENAYHVTQLEQKVAARTAELNEAKEQVETILHNSADGILLTHADLRIQQPNAAFYRLFACTPDDAYGKSLYDLIHPNDRAGVQAASTRARQQQTEQQVEIRCYRQDGTQFEADLSISYSTAAVTGAPRFVCTLHDITVRKQAEAALYQALQKEKDLGELKSRFLSMATHEFRNPLASILLLTETLRTFHHKLSSEQVEQRLGKIQTQVHHLTEIMEDVLQLTRLQARRADYNPTWLDLDLLCRTVLEEFQSPINRPDRLAYAAAGPLQQVQLDKKLMRQIITNLVSNALKYSPDHTTVRVSLVSTGATLIFQVCDEGIGIPAADLDYLFEPFHRAANVDTIVGTGLGLTITKEAVELHGGTITVESQHGIGTTFTVSIPLRTEAV